MSQHCGQSTVGVRRTFGRIYQGDQGLSVSSEEALIYGILPQTWIRRQRIILSASGGYRESRSKLNPADWYYVTEDKSIFYRLCQSNGIHCLELYGILYQDSMGWSSSGPIGNSPESWRNFLSSVDRSAVFLKPSRGHHGLQAFLIEFQGDSWRVNERPVRPDQF